MSTTLEELRAENATLKAKLGLSGDGELPREALFIEIARSLLLPDDAVRAVTKYGHEESTVRIELHLDGDTRYLDCPVKKLVQATVARGVIADVCNRTLDYQQKQWTPIMNLILRAAEKVAGYQRDNETIDWVTGFAQKICMGHKGAEYARPVTDGSAIYDRIIDARARIGGVLEASHTGNMFFIRRADDGLSFSQADFVGYVWTQQGYRLTRAEADQRLAAIGFRKTPQFARKGAQVAKLKACWHSPAGWIQAHEVDLPETKPSRAATDSKD